MKKLTLTIVLALIATLFINAQEKSKIREIGLYTGTIKDLSNMGLRYKFGTEKTIFRLTLVSFNYNESKNDDNSIKYKNMGGGFNIGIEKPIAFSDRFNFYYGPQMGFSYTVTTNETLYTDTKSNDTNVSLGCIAGFSFKAFEKIYLSLEFVPSLSYISTKTDASSSSAIQLSNYNNAGLIIGFRF